MPYTGRLGNQESRAANIKLGNATPAIPAVPPPVLPFIDPPTAIRVAPNTATLVAFARASSVAVLPRQTRVAQVD